MAELAAAEAPLVLPAAAFPTVITIERKVAANALMSVWGSRHSVPPGLVSTVVSIEHRHSSNHIDICAGNRVVATHRLAPAGANRTVRLPEHTAALENMVLAEFATDRPCGTKLNRPPLPTALTIAAQIRADMVAERPTDRDHTVAMSIIGSTTPWSSPSVADTGPRPVNCSADKVPECCASS